MKHIITFTLLIGMAMSMSIFAQPVDETNGTLQALKQTSRAFNKVAEKGQAAVVSISTTRFIKNKAAGKGGYETYFSAGDYEPNYGLPEAGINKKNLGSGVIVSEKGYILTNHHLVADVNDITVTLLDGREFKATLIGSDELSDLAVLKIKGSKLPIIKFGNSNDIGVGDWAIAVGNPFGLSGSVTAGIISAKGRSDIKRGGFSDFIQTDAAINPGNSGGALLNIDGQLIGINSAILSKSGGYMGIGFAIPVNVASKVMDDIIERGHVVRGWLGIMIQPLTPELRQELNISDIHGALISDVIKSSPSERAGLKRGDVITKLNGQPISNFRLIKNKLIQIKIGEKVVLEILRKNKTQTVHVTLKESPDGRSKPQKMSNDPLGLSVAEITKKHQKTFGLNNTEGLVITHIKKNSPAYFKQLIDGDVILEMNKKYLDSIETYQTILKSTDTFLTLIKRQAYTQFLVLKKR